VRVLVVGAGAVGQYLAARLIQAGNDVVIMGRPAQAESLSASGILVRVEGNVFQTSAQAVAGIDDVALQAPFELVVLAVKSFATAQAAAAIADIPACRNASILTVQNGVGNEEVLADVFGAERIVAGALTVAVDRTGPNEVSATAKGGLCIAPLGSNPHNWIIAALSTAKLSVRAVSDWQSLKWSKLCINILGNGVCAALDWTPAQVYADDIAFSIERASLLEAIAVMSLLGVAPINLVNYPAALLIRSAPLLPAPVLRMVLTNRVARARGDKLPSLLMDLRAGREHSEVGTLNGAVALHAIKNGLRAPSNTKLTEIVTGIASGTVDWNAYRGKPGTLQAAIS